MSHSIKFICSLALLTGSFACATASPSPQLVRARAAYEQAKAGPALELNPADIHDATVMLGDAESAAREDPMSAIAIHKAYLAERRAELADAQGKTSAAIRERDLAGKQLVSLKDAALTRTQSQLAQANTDKAQTDARLAQTDAQLAQTRSALGKEREATLATKDQLADATAAKTATENQLADTTAAKAVTDEKLAVANAEGAATKEKLDAEHGARLAADQRSQESLDALTKIAAVRKEARGTVITLSGSVVFRSGKADLLPSAQQRLDQVAEALRSDKRTILIEGHTDSIGSATLNQDLSQRRAAAVLEYLVSKNVGRDRVRSIGLGSTHSVAENTTSEGRANNRRVEIVLEAPAAQIN